MRSGLADVLSAPRSIDAIAAATDIDDLELLEAVLRLGVSVRELRETDGRFSIRGRRLRAIADASTDLRGVVEELIVYDNPVYSALPSHLRGRPAQPYDKDCGDVIAAASRVAEPALGPTVAVIAASQRPARVLDIGCGSGAYLRRVLTSLPTAEAIGIDVDARAVALATSTLTDHRSRCEIRHGDFETLVDELGQFELVLLLNRSGHWALRPSGRGLYRALVSVLRCDGGRWTSALPSSHGSQAG